MLTCFRKHGTNIDDSVLRLISGEHVNNKVDGAILMQSISSLSENMLLQHKPVTVLSNLRRGNSGVYLAVCENIIVVVKEHLFEAGSFLVTSNVLYELSTLLFIFHERHGVFRDVSENLPRAFQIETARNSMRFVFEHLPLSVEDVCDRRLPISFLESMCHQLALVVSTFHNNGMVHRDIKPGNVRFRASGTPVLIDFDSCSQHHNTVSKTFPVCTLYARPPELLHDHVESYDARSLDVFSLGLLFVYMSNSSRPLCKEMSDAGKQHESLMQTLTDGIPNNIRDRLGPRLSTVVVDMLQVDPTQRPNMADVCNRTKPDIQA